MLDIQSLVTQLRRPRLLVRAARFGIDEFRRDRDLPRLLKCEKTPKSGDAIMQLMDVEADLNNQMRQNVPGYTVARHIDVLTAIMSEARTLAATTANVTLRSVT